jgi:hypothetical protein
MNDDEFMRMIKLQDEINALRAASKRDTAITDVQIIAELDALVVYKDGKRAPAYSPESLHWDAENLILAALESRGGHNVAEAFRKLRDTPHCFWYA